jgi:hypothetical protein
LIRHANRSQSQAVGALAVAVVEPSFFRLLMAAIGLAQLQPASELAAVRTAICLSSLTTGANEKQSAATRRAAKALPKWSLTLLMHGPIRIGWTSETEGEKMLTE